MEKKSPKENKQDLLFGNYIAFVNKLFHRTDTNLTGLFAGDGKGTTFLSYDKSNHVKDVAGRAKGLKDEINRDGSGSLAKELTDFTSLTELKDHEQLFKKNPFYKLSQDMLICFHGAAKKYFKASLAQLCSYSPKKLEH